MSARLRRRELDRTSATAVTSAGGLRIDYARHVVEVDGRNEADAVEFAAQPARRGAERAFSRAQIMDHLADAARRRPARVTCISNLRRKIERDLSHPQRIVTVREVGYKLMPV